MSLAVDQPRELAPADSSNSLALAVVGPLDRHPDAVCLARLGSPRSRRVMRGALDTIARLLSDDRCDAVTLDWSAVRYPYSMADRMENVVLTPHTASVSNISDVERRRRVGQEIAAVLQGRLPRSVVNREVPERVSLA
jgi:hypothetical protein